MAKNEDRAKKRGSFPLFLLILLLLALTVIAASVFFRVDEVSVLGASEYSKEEIISISGIRKGSPMLFLSERKIEQKITNALVNISEVSLKKELPSTVVILVNESAAVGYINWQNEKWVLDSEGRVLGGVDTTGLIEILGIQPADMRVGKEIEVEESDRVRLIYLKKVLSALESNNAAKKVSWLDVSNISNITFDFDNDFYVEMGSGENADYKILKLVKVREKLEPGESGKIDISNEGETVFLPR